MAHRHNSTPASVPDGRVSVDLLLKVVALSAAALVAGGTVTVWRGFPPQGLSPGAFVEMQQDAIRGLNVFLPAVALVAILATLALAWLARGVRRQWLLSALVLFFVAGVITRFGNQPINAIVMSWTPDAPPEGWQALRDRWWGLHLVRTAIICVGYLALLLGCLLPAGSQATDR